MRTIRTSTNIKIQKYYCDKCKFAHINESKVIIHNIMAHTQIKALKSNHQLYVYANNKDDLKLFIRFVLNNDYIFRIYTFNNWTEPGWYCILEEEQCYHFGCRFFYEVTCHHITHSSKFDTLNSRLSVENNNIVIANHFE